MSTVDRAAVPAPVRSGERVLYGISHVVLTDGGLYHCPDGAWQRYGWEEIHRVRWVPERAALTVTTLAAGALPRAEVALPRDGRQLADLVAERVAATVLVTGQVTLPGGRARIYARRRPGTGEVSWVVVCGAGVDPRSDAVRARLDAAVHHLRVVWC